MSKKEPKEEYRTSTATSVAILVGVGIALAMSALSIADGLKNIKKGAIDMEMYK